MATLYSVSKSFYFEERPDGLINVIMLCAHDIVLAFTRKLLNLQMYCLLQPLISMQILLTLTWWNSKKSEVLTFHFFINIGNYRPKSKPCEKKVLPVIKFFGDVNYKPVSICWMRECRHTDANYKRQNI